MQKRQHEKSCEIQGGSPEVAVMGGLIMAKFLITATTIQVNSGANSQLEEATEICPNCCY